MPINLRAPQLKELKPRIVVCGVGGAGGNVCSIMSEMGTAMIGAGEAAGERRAHRAAEGDRLEEHRPELALGRGRRRWVDETGTARAVEIREVSRKYRTIAEG